MGVHTVLTTTHITPGLTSQSILVDGVPDFVSILLSLLPITFSQNISQDALRPELHQGEFLRTNHSPLTLSFRRSVHQIEPFFLILQSEIA